MQPHYLEGRNGRLFYIDYSPPSEEIRGAVVVLPPFAEEMNRCRSFTSTVARELCTTGYYVVIADLFGTGDSDGEFKDATWATWREDLALIAEHARGLYADVSLCAVRGGALFVDELKRTAGHSYSKLCMVDPYLSGETLLKDFLRLRVARSLFAGERDSVESLIATLKDGRALEVGGYELSPELFEELYRKTITFEQGSDLTAGLVIGCGSGPDSRRQNNLRASVESWRSAGFEADYKFVSAEPFWSKEHPLISNELVRLVVESYND